ncbi:MAG: TonB-dependent receptor [Calditrichaeota bacterium]|nr:TonB-dependent receptor [Calditrichota bacterium]
MFLTCALGATAWLGAFAGQAQGADGQISGRVLDARTGQALPGANVWLEETQLGAAADAQGRFRIRHVPAGRYALHASMIGYRSAVLRDVQVPAGGRVELVIRLRPAVVQLEPVVVSATKMRQSVMQSPVSLSVVTAEDIRRRNPLDLKQALEMAPGVHFVGNQINVRGSTGFTFGAGNKVLLLLDGVPVYASDTGEFNWDLVAPEDVKQIEVVKGAGSALWGAAALGGVVNIITRDPTPQGRFRYTVTLGKYDHPAFRQWEWTDWGRLHYTRETLSYGKRYEALGVRLSLNRTMDTGYRQLGDAKKLGGTLKLDYHLPGGGRWTNYVSGSWISQGFFIQWKGQNHPYEVDPTQLSNRAHINQLSAYSRLTLPLTPSLAVQARVSLVRTLMGNQFGQPGAFNPAYGSGAEVQVDWIPGRKHSVTVGLQLQRDGGSTRYFGDHVGIYLAPYVQDEWRVRPNFRLTAGLRYDRYVLDGTRREDLLSPRLGLNWQPARRTAFRASVGSGFRAATIVERFLELEVMNFTVKANPALRSERSWAYEVGMRHYVTANWVVDASLFRTDYNQLIEAHLDLIRGNIQFRNIPRARIQGLEASSELSVPVRLFGISASVALRGSLTWMHHEELEFHDPLPYRPKLLARGQVGVLGRAWEVLVEHRYASKIDQVKIYPINQRVPMRFWDASLRLHWRKVGVQLACRNMFNYNYAPMESNLMPPRRWEAGFFFRTP